MKKNLIEGIFQEYIKDLFKNNDTGEIKIIKGGYDDKVKNYISYLLEKHRDIPWVERGDGTQLKLFDVAEDISLQPVRKNGTATIGQVFQHSHKEGQITIIEDGKSIVNVKGKNVNLEAGDIVVISKLTEHKFTDMSEHIKVIDILMPRRTNI